MSAKDSSSLKTASPSNATIANAAPVGPVGDFLLSMPEWNSAVKPAEADAQSKATDKGKRAGARGAGSKPRRSRSTEEFADGYAVVRSDRGYAREARRRRKAEKREAEKAAGITFETKRRELMEALDAISEQRATEEQRKLVRDADKAEHFGKLYACDQSAYDRIFGDGFVFEGGMVAGKYWRKPFVEKGLRTWRHPFFMRVAASIGRAASWTLRTGPTKDGCVLRYNKLHALDEAYAFFCERCRDLFRLDLDRVFESETALRSWIAYIVAENDLPCGPHLVHWIPDDRFPGQVINPQLIFLLPEGHAVWPTSPDRQKLMLGQVIAGLTRVFQCDPGGLAYPFHGKDPISPLTTAIVYQDTHMPMLSEYFEAMDLTLDPELMFRHMLTEKLEEAGFDKADSNTWFSTVAKLSNSGAQILFKGGTAADDPRFMRKIISYITPTVFDAIKPTTAQQKKTVHQLIECCARYTAVNFDPAKMDTRGRQRGAAAHLIEATDSIHVKKSKGQAFAAGVRVAETRSIITTAVLSELKAGREPTIASITALVDRCYNTVKQHFFACYQTAVASLSVETLLRGCTSLPCDRAPSREVLLTANSISDVPESWRSACLDPVIVDHFRLQALRSARKRLAADKPRTVTTRPVGSNVLAFLSAGPVKVTLCTSSEVSQAA
ncbi:hypothetical protein H8A95_04680 [Bradyrhizobium sp. Pear76]|uniref:hypothetical protein n=1 Tax=Bradyrhizobium oropedii TaxID=1571201 RepID=UPI001E4F6735|nr:hypothetical protein [Bradyrhizobium oropedii]MCC8961633.1 hypothetical protein [Bradyrhizobium oropedii]